MTTSLTTDMIGAGLGYWAYERRSSVLTFSVQKGKRGRCIYGKQQCNVINRYKALATFREIIRNSSKHIFKSSWFATIMNTLTQNVKWNKHLYMRICFKYKKIKQASQFCQHTHCRKWFKFDVVNCWLTNSNLLKILTIKS